MTVDQWLAGISCHLDKINQVVFICETLHITGPQIEVTRDNDSVASRGVEQRFKL
jgi:hypothetical protein